MKVQRVNPMVVNRTTFVTATHVPPSSTSFEVAEDSGPQTTELIVNAMLRMPRADKQAVPSDDAWLRWHDFLEKFGFESLGLGDMSIWAEEMIDDEVAYRFTLTENWPDD
jgi:hypothetical protein